MIVKKAYNIEKFFSKFHIHALDMIVWHALRAYLNYRLPRYYRKNKSDYHYIDSSKLTDREVIVSLTTYPKRMKSIPLVLETIYNQSVRPTRIILWLAKDQYNNPIKVERHLSKFVKRGLEICYCDDLRAHKKYYYSMKENPEALVITLDDDILYPEDMLESLLKKHNEYPNCIVTCRAHEMKFNGKKPVKYRLWNTLARGCTGPSLNLCATGGAGCLYPPGSLSSRVFDKDVFMGICKYADDIWMKCMSYIQGTPIVLTGKDNPEIITVKNNDEGGLAKKNVFECQNDEQLKAVTKRYAIKWKNVEKSCG